MVQPPHIPLPFYLLVFLVPIFTLVWEAVKYFVQRRDTKKSPPATPVQVVTGEVFSFDKEVLALMRSQAAEKDQQLEALRRENRLYLKALIEADVPVPDLE